MGSKDIVDGLIMYLGLVVLLTFHEYGHAWMALKCGDDTGGGYPDSIDAVLREWLEHSSHAFAVCIVRKGVIAFHRAYGRSRSGTLTLHYYQRRREHVGGTLREEGLRRGTSELEVDEPGAPGSDPVGRRDDGGVAEAGAGSVAR